MVQDCTYVIQIVLHVFACPKPDIKFGVCRFQTRPHELSGGAAAATIEVAKAEAELLMRSGQSLDSNLSSVAASY